MISSAFAPADLIHLAPVLAVLGGAIVTMLMAAFARGRDASFIGGFALAFFAAAIWLDLRALSSPVPVPESVAAMLTPDAFSALADIVIYAGGALCVMMAGGYFRTHNLVRGEFFSLMLFSAAGMSLMAMAADLLVLIIGLELASLSLYVMAAFSRTARASPEAGLKYFVTGAFASAFLVFGAALLYGFAVSSPAGEGMAGSPLNIGILAIQIRNAAESGGVTPILAAGLCMVLVGLAFKLGMVPFHMWVPDVYQGAPTPATAFMAAGMKAAAAAALVKILLVAFGKDMLFGTGGWWLLLAVIAVLTMSVGNLVALAQNNIKRMLAYSSIAHTGYLMLGLLAAAWVGPGTPEGIEAAVAVGYYVAAYMLMNVTAFAVVSYFETPRGGNLLVSDYAGLSRRHPGLILILAVALFSLAGMPPTVGFFAKFYVFKAAIDAKLYWLAVAGVINSLVSFYYYLRVLIFAYMHEPVPAAPREAPTALLKISLAFSSLAILWYGLFPTSVLSAARSAFAFLASIKGWE
jgi:NADH-quinone oxidoreductase subunit N